MIRNCFVEALNRRLKFPSAVIILTSDQLIIEDPLYLPSEVDRKLKWIIRELDAAVKIRKSSLPLKAYKFGEPRIMWVRAFQNTRANYISNEILMKFNNMLRKTCMAKAIYTIPTVKYNDTVVRCFDYDGKTQIKEGFDLLWHDIILGLKRHDEADRQAEIANTLHEHNQTQSGGRSRKDHYTGSQSRSQHRCRHSRKTSSRDRDRDYSSCKTVSDHREYSRSNDRRCSTHNRSPRRH